MSKERILVVDDERTILELGQRFLSSEGFDVETASQGMQAMKLLEQGPYEILLTDIRMPGMSGLELMKMARSVRPEIIMVVITGHGTITTAIESLKMGAMGFILKPFTRQELLSAIHNALDKYRLRQENVRMKSLMPLFQVNQQLMMQTDLTHLMRLIVDLVKTELKVDRASIMLLNEKTGELVVKATTGFENLDENKLKKHVGEGIAGLAVEKKQPILVQGGIEENPDLKGLLDDEKVASGLAVPIMIRKKVIGVLNLSKFNRGQPLGESDLGLISIFCGQVAVAIENARLYRDIRNSYLRTLQALVAAIEIKDQFSKGHSSGVAQYAAVIGKALQLSKGRMQDLIIAAILHDIGKIGSSDDILKKGSKLSEDEFELMKSHPGNAVKILETIGLSREILSSILHHHEWWDGSGYPKGLSREEIPLFSRIIAIADTIDAMTTPRPYQQAVTLAEARDEIRRFKGSQFDPNLVDIFLGIEEKTLLDPEFSDLDALSG
ncbi:MAG: response regulator [Candidatus Manganitrophus sp. SB1]|nr:response regulator [Candidatus Manganitrophus morganii]